MLNQPSLSVSLCFAEDAGGQDTQLPSEMFVSNQKHWLQLRASNPGSGFPLLRLCCGDAMM